LKDVDGRDKPGHDAPANSRYGQSMTIEEIEKAVVQLPPDQLAQFRAWFEEFDAARFDQKIERDADSGKLDRLPEQAIDDYRKRHAREP
jgi:hypothetical protein